VRLSRPAAGSGQGTGRQVGNRGPASCFRAAFTSRDEDEMTAFTLDVVQERCGLASKPPVAMTAGR